MAHRNRFDRVFVFSLELNSFLVLFSLELVHDVNKLQHLFAPFCATGCESYIFISGRHPLQLRLSGLISLF